MKHFLIIFFAFLSTGVYSQQRIDTLYLSDANQIVDKINAVKYEIHAYNDTISGSGIIKVYTIGHNLMSETEYLNIKSKYSTHKNFTRNGYNKGYFDSGNIKYMYHYKLNKLDSIGETFYESGKRRSISNYMENALNGSNRTYFESGQLQFDENYKNGDLHGDLKTYFENGTLKRHDIYNEGKLVSGHFYDKNGNEIEYVDYSIRPEYEGGYTAISEFLSKFLRYPKNMKNMGIEGTVQITFTIKKNGAVDNVKVRKSPHQELTNEALRVFNLLRDWKPGKKDGEYEDFMFSLPIRFDLD